MFNPFQSAGQKARSSAAPWLDLTRTVWNFRRDLMTREEADELLRAEAALRRLLGERAGEAAVMAAVESLEGILRRTGGSHYPRRAVAENVEFFLVATLVVLGVRAFFIQPMVIPTNSMWPTYYGMTAENFPPDGKAPGPLARVARLAAFGAVREEVDAPSAGEVSIPLVFDANGQPHVLPTAAMGRKWLIFPDKRSEYTLLVNDLPVKLSLPEDFHDFDRVVMDTFFGGSGSFADRWNREKDEGGIRRTEIVGAGGQAFYAYRLPTGRRVRPGEPLVRFDLMKGDMVFVDRMSFHFVRPKVGTAFVFETGNIPGFMSLGFPDEYLIKRLVGGPGDTLRIVPPVLYRNGRPIEGAAAFEANAGRIAPYRGYLNAPEGRGLYLLPGESATVPARSFMGLGDNSTISEDSRYWGFVPEKDVVGRPLFVYYPFTRRWGSAR